MDLNALEVFVAVAQAPSLSAAARALEQPVSTVSRRLQDLERDLDAVLVLRTTRSLRLTDAGRALLKDALGPLRELRQVTARLRERSGEPTGLLRVAAAPTVAAHFLPEPITGYLARHRSVSVELLIGAAPLDLRMAGVDVALRVGRRSTDPSLVVRRLHRSRSRVVAASHYLTTRGVPTTIAALANHDVIALSQAPAWQFEDVGDVLSVAPRVLVQSAEVARLLCLEGAGLALLPEFLVADDLRQGHLVEVALHQLPAAKDVYLTYAQENRRLPRVRAFIDVLVESLDR